MKKCLIILGLLVVSYITQFVWLEKAHDKIIAEKQYVIDSLVSENIGLNIDVERYEIILDNIRTVDSNLVDSAMTNVE